MGGHFRWPLRPPFSASRAGPRVALELRKFMKDNEDWYHDDVKEIISFNEDWPKRSGMDCRLADKGFTEAEDEESTRTLAELKKNTPWAAAGLSFTSGTRLE